MTTNNSCCNNSASSTSSSTSLSSTTPASSPPPPLPDIEDLHQQAVLGGLKSYEDPETGFTVFTEIMHLQRGTCCGNQCRHCPYGWENVPQESVRRPAKVKSGDRKAGRQLLADINDNAKAAAALKNNNDTGESVIGRRRKKKIGGTYGGRLTEKNVPYTKKGDQGTSQLLTGEYRSKNDAAFDAMGTVDELCSVVGVAHALLIQQQQQQQHTTNIDTKSPSGVVEYGELPEWLLQVMSRLFDAGSHIAKPVRCPDNNDDEDDDEGEDGDNKFEANGVGGGMDKQHVEALEDWIDTMTEALPELRNFILPTGSLTAAQFHVCRTVCRRAERGVVPLVDLGVCDPNVLQYLNRLSDFFFVASRWCNLCQGTPEFEYRRPQKRDKQRVATAKNLTKATK